MPPRLFQDLVVSGLARSGRDRARALPVSLVFHGVALGALVILPQLATDLPPVSAAPPPPIPAFHQVQVVEITPRVPPPVRTAAPRRAQPATPQVEPAAPATGGGPTLPSDLSRLGSGDPFGNSPALCLSNCTPGDGTGAVLPDATGRGSGGGEATPRRAGLDVTPPAKLSGDPPVYPEIARRGRVQGDVVIECTIDPSGRVVNVVVTKSNPLFDDAALAAVRGWRYRPTLVDGVPVPVLMTVTVRFRIH